MARAQQGPLLPVDDPGQRQQGHGPGVREPVHGRAPDPGDGERLDALGVRAPFVAFVGTLEPRKGVPALIGAVDRLALAHKDLQLVLAGRPGWGVDEVEEALAGAPALARRVVRTGYVDDPTRTALLRGAAVVAYPSLELSLIHI